MAKYTIGLDFGTLSGRAVVVDVHGGRILAVAEATYSHGVMTECLPDGTKLPQDWTIQHPQDYLDVLAQIVPEAVRQSGIPAEDIIGIGVDVTACTAMPVDREGIPLCLQPEWEHHPHAYIKLWKHHAAQGYADKITQIAEERHEPWLRRYGGKVSSEWSLPKLWEVLDQDPAVYSAMYEWVEVADWLVWQLTGCDTRNACAAGYKNFYAKSAGYPDDAFYAALDPRLKHVIAEKCFSKVLPAGSRAGSLKPDMAQKLGLAPGIAVAVGNVDAHVCVPAAGMARPGQMLGIIGTSACYMNLAEKEIDVPGICGAVEDGLQIVSGMDKQVIHGSSLRFSILHKSSVCDYSILTKR